MMKSLILKTILFKITCALPISLVPPGFTHCANSGGLCYCNGLVFIGLPELNMWYNEPLYSHDAINCTTDIGKCWCLNDVNIPMLEPLYTNIDSGIQLWKEFNTTLFNSPQSFNILNIDTSIRKLSIAYTENILMTTPDLASSINGLAAVNGGFHAYGKNIGSITKLRVNNNDIVINDTVENWDLTDEDVEGVLTINVNGSVDIVSKIDIDNWSNAYTYLHSGPLLLLNGIEQPLENNNWNYVRNPRTGICISYNGSIKLITIDGRFYTSSGMTLLEFQIFLKSIGCKSAINLDGGGSTTMYLKNVGIINEPRDKPPPGIIGFNTNTIVRKISNAIVVI